MDIKERVFEERLRGHCCSETIMNMFLEDIGRSDEERRDLVRAMGAFCGGMREGLVCGTLVAAAAALGIADDGAIETQGEFRAEMMAWFREHFGAWNCAELLEGDESRKFTLCPVIVEETYGKLWEILDDAGIVMKS